MEEIFLTNIDVDTVRNLNNLRIALCSEQKKHLIITGKNGSGKTTLLNEFKKFLTASYHGNLNDYEGMKQGLVDLETQKKSLSSTAPIHQIHDLDNRIKHFKDWLLNFGGTKMEFNYPLLVHQYAKEGNFIIAYFEAKRNISLKTPLGINKINMKQSYSIDEKAGVDFIQYIVNLKADRSFAKDDNDDDTVAKIDNWFRNFEESLIKLFDYGIKLQFDSKNYNFSIIEDTKEPYHLSQLSDGYSAILNIVTELIMRMEEHKTKSYDVQGVVLVDEIETHLHIELQKRILPFLTSFFPGIQFIVTTHSPFVLSSIENAIICDLEKRIVIPKDLTGYSYDTLIESYFDSDKYSAVLKDKIEKFEVLMQKRKLSDTENGELSDLRKYLKEIPKFVADELAVKLNQLHLKEIAKR